MTPQTEQDLSDDRAAKTIRAPRRLRRTAVLAAAALSLAVAVGVAIALWPGAEASRRPDDGGPAAGVASIPAGVLPELQGAWAAISSPGTVVHLIARIERQTFEAAPEGYTPAVRITRVEFWSDPESGATRKRAQERQADGSWATTQEELVEAGVWTVYQYGMTSTDGGWEPMNVLRYDADLAEQGPGDPFTVQADLSEYRAMIATGTATYGGPSRSGGNGTYLVCYRLSDTWYSSETTVHVSVDTDLPIRTEIVRWYTTADGVRHLAERGSVTFEVSETLAREDVPDGTFTLTYPDDIPVITDLTLDLEGARHARGVRPLWLGSEWEGMALSQEIPYSSYEGEKPLGGMSHHRHGLRAADASADLGDSDRPAFDGPWITLEYGTARGPDIRISSVPLVEAAGWKDVQRYGELTTLDGRPAMRTHIVYQFHDSGYSAGPAETLEVIPGATRAEYRFLTLNVGPSTVVLQGYGVTDEDLARAAAALEPLE